MFVVVVVFAYFFIVGHCIKLSFVLSVSDEYLDRYDDVF